MIYKLAPCLLLLLLGPVFSQNCTNTYGTKRSGVCKGVDECTGAALKGNCSDSKQICCINDKTIEIGEHKKLTKEIFLKLVGNTTRTSWIYDYVVESMKYASLEGKFEEQKIAAYLSQLVGETQYFRRLESEKADGDDKDKDDDDKNNYLGRGAIFIRGRNNYVAANKSTKYDIGHDIVKNPEMAAFPSVAFKLAAWFWKENALVILTNRKAQKGDLNQLVDGTFHNYSLLTYAITTSTSNIFSRASFNDKVLVALKSPSLKRGSGIGCQIDKRKGVAVPLCTHDHKRPYCGCDGEVDMKSCPYNYNSGNKCRNPTITKCCIETDTCINALDLVVVMDSSDSLGIRNFETQKRFVKNLLAKFKLGPNDTLLSLINYNTKTQLYIDFMNFTDYSTTASVIDKIPYTGGYTYTFDALRLANDQVLTESRGMRPMEGRVPKVVIVITDGVSNNKTQTLVEADRIKSRGIEIITVGIGYEIDMDELIGMASSPDDQFFVDDFDKLESLLQSLLKKTCVKLSQVQAETRINDRVDKGAYKYYKLDLKRERGLKKFSINLAQLKGRTVLVHSFENEHPISDDDLVSVDNSTDEEGNFVDEDNATHFAYSNHLNHYEPRRIEQRGLYEIERTDEDEALYLAVKGYDDVNEFEMFIYNRTIFDKSLGERVTVPRLLLALLVHLVAIAIFYIN